MIPLSRARDNFAARQANQRLRKNPALVRRPSGAYMGYLGEAYARISAPEIIAQAERQGLRFPLPREELFQVLRDVYALMERDQVLYDWDTISTIMQDWFLMAWWKTLREKGITT